MQLFFLQSTEIKSGKKLVVSDVVPNHCIFWSLISNATVIMIFVAYNLIGSLKRVKKKKTQMTTGTIQSGTVKNGNEDLTLTLIIVVVFVFCNMFNPVRRAIVGKYGDIAGSCPHFLYPFTSLNSTIHIFNASVNFTVYVLGGKTFRKRVKALLLCKGNKVGFLGFTDSNAGSSNEKI